MGLNVELVKITGKITGLEIKLTALSNRMDILAYGSLAPSAIERAIAGDELPPLPPLPVYTDITLAITEDLLTSLRDTADMLEKTVEDHIISVLVMSAKQ